MERLKSPGAIWLAVAFSSVMALSRTWQREREDNALLGLLVTPLPRASLFLGKMLGVLAFELVIELIVVPLVSLFFHVDLPRVVGPLALILTLATVGVSAYGTLFGAMTVRTRARDLVFATVLFPLLSPTLIAGVARTRWRGSRFGKLKIIGTRVVALYSDDPANHVSCSEKLCP